MNSIIEQPTDPQKPKFKPFVLRIEVETLAQALILRALGGASATTAKSLVENADYMQGFYYINVSNEIRETFRIVDDELLNQEVI